MKPTQYLNFYCRSHLLNQILSIQIPDTKIVSKSPDTILNAGLPTSWSCSTGQTVCTVQNFKKYFSFWFLAVFSSQFENLNYKHNHLHERSFNAQDSSIRQVHLHIFLGWRQLHEKYVHIYSNNALFHIWNNSLPDAPRSVYVTRERHKNHVGGGSGEPVQDPKATVQLSFSWWSRLCQ